MTVLFNSATWPPVLLAWSFLLLLPFGRAFELPILIMAILGGVLIWKHGKQAVWQGGAKTFSLLFLCIWIPIVLSVPDSLWFDKSLRTALTYPRIYFVGIYLIWILQAEPARQRLFKLTAWLVLFWVFDALIQVVFGTNLLGYDYPERLNGLWGPRHWKLGITLAMLSPIVWEYVARHGTKWQLALAWLGTAAVVLLASNRQSWVIFLLASLLWGAGYVRQHGLNPIRISMAIILVTLMAGVIGYQGNSKLAVQIDKSLHAKSFTYKGLDTASSGRLHIFRNATRAFLNHPVNGVGVRAYRYAYPLYAFKDDIFVGQDGTGAIYAHQIVFEVGSEAGTIGLIGLLLFYGVLWRALRHPTQRVDVAWPAMIGAAAWLFPFNTHTAIYSAYWALLVGWLLAVGLVALTHD